MKIIVKIDFHCYQLITTKLNKNTTNQIPFLTSQLPTVEGYCEKLKKDNVGYPLCLIASLFFWFTSLTGITT